MMRESETPIGERGNDKKGGSLKVHVVHFQVTVEVNTTMNDGRRSMKGVIALDSTQMTVGLNSIKFQVPMDGLVNILFQADMVDKENQTKREYSHQETVLEECLSPMKKVKNLECVMKRKS